MFEELGTTGKDAGPVDRDAIARGGQVDANGDLAGVLQEDERAGASGCRDDLVFPVIAAVVDRLVAGHIALELDGVDEVLRRRAPEPAGGRATEERTGLARGAVT